MHLVVGTTLKIILPRINDSPSRPNNGSAWLVCSLSRPVDGPVWSDPVANMARPASLRVGHRRVVTIKRNWWPVLARVRSCKPRAFFL